MRKKGIFRRITAITLAAGLICSQMPVDSAIHGEDIATVEEQMPEISSEENVEQASGVALTAENFPDANFLAALKTCENGTPDGYLDNKEQYEDMNFTGMNITNTQGIKLLTGSTVIILDDNPIEQIDVSNMTNLVELRLERCGLNTINITGCSNLATLSVIENNLTTLDFTGCTSLSSLRMNKNKLAFLNIDQQSVQKDLVGSDSANYQYPSVWMDSEDCIGLSQFPGMRADRIYNSSWASKLQKGGTLEGQNIKVDTSATVGTEKDSRAFLVRYYYSCFGGTGTSYAKARMRVDMDAKQLAKSITLNKSTLTMQSGETQKLTATISPSTAYYETGDWSSSNVNVATVDSQGNVTAKGAGTAIISCTAKDPGKVKGTCTVTVGQSAVPVSSITLSKQSLSLEVGNTSTISATVNPSNATNKNVSFTSLNTNIATVSQNGTITAKAAGNTTIRCTAQDGSGKYADCQLTVTKKTVTVHSVSLSATNVKLAVNGTKTLTPVVSVTPDESQYKGVTFTSNNPSVATVDSQGLVTAKAVGTAVITCASKENPNVSAKATINVIVPVSDVVFAKSREIITVGQGKSLTHYIYPDNATDQSVSYRSSDTNIVTVNNGWIQGIKAGTATITCTSNDNPAASAKITIEVKKPVSNVHLLQTYLKLYVGDAGEQLVATVNPSDAISTEVKWTSGNQNVAIVSDTGVVTAVGAGSTTITCTSVADSSKSASCNVDVMTRNYNVPTTSVYITLSKGSQQMKVGETGQLVATVSPGNATNKTINWISSNTKVLTVDTNGAITAVGPGTATIDAISIGGNNVKASMTFTVTQMVTSVKLDVASKYMNQGDTYVLKTTVLPTNASNASVSYTSSNTNVATVSTQGVISAVAPGTATITCKANDGSGQSATCSVKVYTSVEAFVARIYEKALGRAPEMGGLTYWAGEIAAGRKSPVSVAEQFIFSQEFTKKNLDNTEYIKVLYRTFMGREADAGGLGYWVGRLNKGETREKILREMANSTEFQNIIKSFGLPAEVKVTGITLNKKSAALAPKATLQLSATIAPTNASNKAVTWTSSNTKVATVSSAGKVTAVSAGTATITCKAADGSGKSATCIVTVYTNTEAFVARIYTMALSREPEASGFKYWTGEINAKRKTPVAVAEQFIFSPEFTGKNLNNTDYVKVLYRTFMGREADQAGINYWVGQLNKGVSRKSVLRSFAGCQEFKNIVAGFGL